MSRRRIAVILGLLVVALPFGAAYRVLHEESGLQWLLAQLGRLPGLRIEATGASGTLAGPLAIERLLVDHAAVRIEARGLRLDARLRPLLGGNVHLEQASVAGLEVVLKTREEQPPEQPHFLPRFLEIAAPDLRLGNVGLTLPGGKRIGVASIRAALEMSRGSIALHDLVVEDPAGRIDGSLRLLSALPLRLRTAANGHWRMPDGRTYRFATAARGKLDRLAATATLAEPANMSFVGTLLSLDEAPRVVGTLRATDFDGSPWMPAGLWPRASGSIALNASADAFGLDGTLSADALGDGPLRVQGSGRWHDRTLELGSLRLWLPRSTLSLEVAGTIGFSGNAPALELAGDWTALRWPLSGDASLESPVGTFSLNGSLPYAFDVQAHARAPALQGAPEARFTAAGSIDRERLVLDRLDGVGLGGHLAGSGTVAWAGEQAWSARLDVHDLDIATVRPDLRGHVSAVATVEGRGFAPAPPWTVRLASMSGTVAGRALTGRGEISHRDGVYDLREVRIANGASHIDLNGRWGSTVDLRWSANVRTLALLHPDLAGELVSSGRARGSSSRPRVEAELRARGLQFAGIAAQSVDAEVDVDATDSHESRVEIQATNIDLGPVQLDSVRFDAHGLLAGHDLTLEFSSPGGGAQRLPSVGGRVGLRGVYATARHAWLGSLEQASITFPDGGATLLQPAAIEASADALRVAPVCLQTGEARLCAEGERRSQPDAWSIIYSAQDWPLRRLLRSILGWKEFDGRLQAAGWLAGEQGRDWIGGMTLLVDEPTLDIPRNKFRTERLALGRGRLDVFADPGELRANLELALAENTSVRGEVIATRSPALKPADYPLRGTLRGESPALTAIPVFVPEIDRSDGRLDATVSVGGTLGEPRFDGEFRVRDGRFDLYRTNLLLSDVTLDGRFIGDELVFNGSGRTASGTLALDGQFTWPGDVMTGELHLKGDKLVLADTPEYHIVASPDLTIAAGSEGYRVRGEVLIPKARIAPRDLTMTVATSSDERLVGAEEVDTGPSTLERLRARVRVVLGDDVRVDSLGLKAKLAGAVTVISRPGDIVRGNGSIRVVEGEYKAFGQFVRITRGVLSYNRTPLDDPTLDLVGEREIKAEDIVVRINVRGTLSSPFVTVSSEPPMSESEALSYLLTGRSINTLQSGEAASLDRAAQSLAVGGGGLLLGGIGNRIGLDEVAVESTGEDDTSVVLGKYLSPKLFVSYGISIVEAINTIKLRYTLNERWSLKAEAGLEQSGDIEFKIER